MKIQYYGDSALLINFDQIIDQKTNQEVIFLDQYIQQAAIPGVKYTIPAYCSLTIGYDPIITGFDDLRNRVMKLVNEQGETEKVESRLLKIPVCYEEHYAFDMTEVSAMTGLTTRKVIDEHTSNTFRVFMLGFLPGFVYLGKLPEALHCKRKEIPRLRVPALSVGLAGYQTGIYPTQAPGGWQIIGKTPVPIFNPHWNNPFLFRPGDSVRFHQVSQAEFLAIAKNIGGGKFEWESIYE